jgi:hypothetical protein
MKLTVKNAVIAAISLGAAAVGASAQASIALPSSGNGELVLLVTNTTTGDVYARGLSVTLDNIVTQTTTATATAGSVNAVSYSLAAPVTHDGALTTFLGTAGGVFTWNVLAGDNTGSTAGLRRYALTSQIDLAATSSAVPVNTGIGNLGAAENTFLTTVNGFLPAGNGTSAVIAAANLDYTLADNFFNVSPGSTASNLGATANFYVLSNTSGNSSKASLFVLNGLTLSSVGDLSSVSVSSVPVPAAVWLMGSGLAGLFGIGRRRKLAAV